jgi:hypothetical protein
MKRLLIIGAAAIAALGALLTTSASASAPHDSLAISPRFVSVPGDGPGGCWGVATGGFACNVTLTNPSSSNTQVEWDAIGSDSSFGTTTASPRYGLLAPGKSVVVKVTTNMCGGYSDLQEFIGFPYGGNGWNLGGSVLYSCG